MSDITLHCIQCGTSFIWSSGEQEFFHALNYLPPKHCKVCRAHRRADRDAGMRGFSGPPAAGAMPGVTAGTRSAREPAVPLIPMPLWRSLRRSHEMRLVSQFVHLDPATAPTLDAETFSLLMQWMFEQFERETLSAEAQSTCLDLRLHYSVEQREEFAHIYTGHQDGLPDSIYDLLDRLGDRLVSQIYLCTFFSLTSHQREVGRQAPVAIDLLEGERLNARLQEAQQRFRARLEWTRPSAAPIAPVHSEMPIIGEISGQARPYYLKKTPS